MRLAAITAILASAALIAAPAAFADGDPASDVLVESVLFNPIDGVSQASQAKLEAVLNASAQRRLPDPRRADRQREGPRHRDAAVERARQVRAVSRHRARAPVPRPGAGRDAERLRAARAARTGRTRCRRPRSPCRRRRPGRASSWQRPRWRPCRCWRRPPVTRSPPRRWPPPNDSATAGQKSVAGTSFSAGAVVALLLGALLIALAWWASLRARPLQLRRRLEP